MKPDNLDLATGMNRVEIYLLFLKILTISIHSSMLQGLLHLSAKLSNTWHMATGKDHHGALSV